MASIRLLKTAPAEPENGTTGMVRNIKYTMLDGEKVLAPLFNGTNPATTTRTFTSPRYYCALQLLYSAAHAALALLRHELKLQLCALVQKVIQIKGRRTAKVPTCGPSASSTLQRQLSSRPDA